MFFKFCPYIKYMMNSIKGEVLILKDRHKLLLSVVTVTSVVSMLVSPALASEQEWAGVNADLPAVTSTTDLYTQGVQAGKIDPKVFSQSSWMQYEKDFLMPNYEQILKENVLPSPMTYAQWVEWNNWGTSDMSNNPEFSVVATDDPHLQVSPSQKATNAKKFAEKVKKGDFMVVSNHRDPGAPYVGHAAIATTDKYILDMPGYRDGSRPKDDNNRQLTKQHWIGHYKKGWVTLYRLNASAKVRSDIATWADWRYWSSKHEYTKNRHVEYSLVTPNKGDFGRAYCSKLVYQAMYYGSGDLPLLKPTIPVTIIAPGQLYDYVAPKYKPTKIGVY